jgi:arsenate reductase
MPRPFKVLFLCTGNSARSILAEFLLREMAPERFEVFSAGAQPTGVVNPLATKVLAECFGIDASSARSKSWEEFKDVAFDLVITVCDNARESCPIWPGRPAIAHWSSEDPVSEQTFLRVALQIQQRLTLLCALPLEKLERQRLEQATQEIGTLG